MSHWPAVHVQDASSSIQEQTDITMQLSSAPASPRPEVPDSSLAPAADIPKFRPRACARCSASKLKCKWVSEPGEAPCERCSRSRSECVLPSLRRRGPRRGQTTRVGQLEQKLDGLMSLLSASQQLQNTATTAASTLQPLAPLTPGNSPGFQPDTSSSQPLGTAATSVSAGHSPDAQASYPAPASASVPTNGPPGHHPDAMPFARHVSPAQNGQPMQLSQSVQQIQPPPPEQVEIIPDFVITMLEGEAALADYRRRCSSHFPFVPLPPDLSARELYQQKPLLFRIIVLIVKPPSPPLQRYARRWFLEQLSHRVVVEQEKSLELLQATLLSLSWTHYCYFIEMKTTPLVQLAMGLMVDLGLHKSHTMMMSIPGQQLTEATRDLLRGKDILRPNTARSIEDMRAALGCYFVCTTVSSFSRRACTFSYNSYFDNCCRVLQEKREFESDSFLVALVYLAKTTYRIYVTLPNPDSDLSLSSGSLSLAPLLMSVNSIRKELDVFLQNLPQEVTSNDFFWLNYHAVLLRLYESAIHMRPPPSSPTSTTTRDPLDGVQRADCLWNCLLEIQTFTGTYCRIPVALLSYIPYMSLVHMSFCLVTSLRLLFLMDDPDWDVVRARRQLDFVAMSLRLEEHLRSWQELIGVVDGRDSAGDRGIRAQPPENVRCVSDDNYRYMMFILLDRLRWIRLWIAAKLPVEQRGLAAAAAGDIGQERTLGGQLMERSLHSAGSSGATPCGSRETTLPPLSLPSFSPSPMAGGHQKLQPSAFLDMDGIGGVGEFHEEDASFWKAMLDMDGIWDAGFG